MLDKEWCYCGRPDCAGYAVAELNELHYETPGDTRSESYLQRLCTGAPQLPRYPRRSVRKRESSQSGVEAAPRFLKYRSLECALPACRTIGRSPSANDPALIMMAHRYEPVPPTTEPMKNTGIVRSGRQPRGDKPPYVMVIQHVERHAAGEPGRALRYGVVKAFIGLLTPSLLPLESIDSTV
jgi:hypothetical protein